MRERILWNKGCVVVLFEGMLKIILLLGRRLVRIVWGYLCFVLFKVEVGDKFMIICGCFILLVLRCVKEEMDCFKIIGDVYVYGVMFGEYVMKDFVWWNIMLV